MGLGDTELKKKKFKIKAPVKAKGTQSIGWLDSYEEGTPGIVPDEKDSRGERFDDVTEKALNFSIQNLNSPKYLERLNKEVEAQKERDNAPREKEPPITYESTRYIKDENGDYTFDENGIVKEKYMRTIEEDPLKPRYVYDPNRWDSSFNKDSERKDLGLNADYILQSRKNRINNLHLPSNFEEGDKWAKEINNNEGGIAGIYSPTEHKIGLVDGLWGDDDRGDDKYEKTYTHELGHGETQGSLGMLPVTKEKIEEFAKENESLRGDGGLKEYDESDGGGVEYYTNPTEVKARLNVTRESMRNAYVERQKEVNYYKDRISEVRGKRISKKNEKELMSLEERLKISEEKLKNTRDPFTQDITEKDIEDLKDDKEWLKYKPDKNTRDLFDNFTPKQIKWMMNNIAKGDKVPGSGQEVLVAKNGLSIEGTSDVEPKKKKPAKKENNIVFDPQDKGLHKYLDSLNLYKGYQEQLRLIPEDEKPRDNFDPTWNNYWITLILRKIGIKVQVNGGNTTEVKKWGLRMKEISRDIMILSILKNQL
jgi:hypothetical protein